MEYSIAIRVTDELMALPEKEFDEVMLTVSRQVIGAANAKREELGYPVRMGSTSRALQYAN